MRCWIPLLCCPCSLTCNRIKKNETNFIVFLPESPKHILDASILATTFLIFKSNRMMTVRNPTATNCLFIPNCVCGGKTACMELHPIIPYRCRHLIAVRMRDHSDTCILFIVFSLGFFPSRFVLYSVAIWLLCVLKRRCIYILRK